MNTQQLDHTYIANTYARYPVTIVRGKGSLVWDENGKEYIDLATGIAVNSFGVSSCAPCSTPQTSTSPRPTRSWRSCCAKRPA